VQQRSFHSYYSIEEREKPGKHYSFFTVELVEATLQWEEDGGSMMYLMDLFVSVCSLTVHFHQYGYKNAFHSSRSLVHLVS